MTNSQPDHESSRKLKYPDRWNKLQLRTVRGKIKVILSIMHHADKINNTCLTEVEVKVEDFQFRIIWCLLYQYPLPRGPEPGGSWLWKIEKSPLRFLPFPLFGVPSSTSSSSTFNFFFHLWFVAKLFITPRNIEIGVNSGRIQQSCMKISDGPEVAMP